MAVVISSENPWLPNPLSFVLLFMSSFFSLYFHRKSSSSSSMFLDVDPMAPFLRFQRSFLLLFSLSSVVEGMGLVFGEYEYADYGVGREEMAIYLAGGAAAALLVGPFLGIVSDIVGPRKSCLLFCILHLLVGVMKCMSKNPSIWITSICLALASSVYSFCFEIWMVNEHEKQGYIQDLLNETFWLMTFFESASFIGGQGLANILIKDLHSGFLSPAAASALLALIGILYIRKQCRGDQQKSAIVNYRKSFVGHILKDKMIWLLAWAQTSIYFSMSAFWFLWAPTIVVQLILHYVSFYHCRISVLFMPFISNFTLVHAMFVSLLLVIVLLKGPVSTKIGLESKVLALDFPPLALAIFKLRSKA